MKIIMSNQSIPILVDDDEYKELSQFAWNVYDRYAESYINGRTVKMHRMIMHISNPSEHVDHINGITIDNRKENLRVCSRFQNQQNRKLNKNSKTKNKGIVLLPSGNFRVRVQAFGIRYEVGVFTTIEEAVYARETAAKEKHREFYR